MLGVHPDDYADFEVDYDVDDNRDYAEEEDNRHIMHTGDGEAECGTPACPYYVKPTIKCGSCKGKHTTVAWVKLCYGERNAAEDEAKAEIESDKAFAKYLENRAENGSWFGFGE